MNYRRIPGTKVTYGRDATLYYVSPLARYQRGLNLSPALTKTLSASTREFWYRSQRAPDGYWRCKVSDNPFAPGGGGAGCPPAGSTLVFGTTWCVRYEIRVNRHGTIFRSDGSVVSTFSGSISPTVFVWGPITSVFWESGVSNGVYWATCAGRADGGPDYVPPPGASSIGEYRLYNLPSFAAGEYAEVTIDSIDIVSSTPTASCTPGTDPDCSGGEPDETGDYGGLYYYLCDCPDKRRLQGALNRPRFASEAIARDWSGSRAGARNIPCKHIYATAAQVGDVLLLTPAPTGRPARESGIDPWELYRRLYDQWRKDYGQIHSAERRFQRAARRFTGRIEGRARAAARLQRKAFNDNMRRVSRLGRYENRDDATITYVGNLTKQPVDPFLDRFQRRLDRANRRALGDEGYDEYLAYRSDQISHPVVVPKPTNLPTRGSVPLPSASRVPIPRPRVPPKPPVPVRSMAPGARRRK